MSSFAYVLTRSGVNTAGESFPASHSLQEGMRALALPIPLGEASGRPRPNFSDSAVRSAVRWGHKSVSAFPVAESRVKPAREAGGGKEEAPVHKFFAEKRPFRASKSHCADAKMYEQEAEAEEDTNPELVIARKPEVRQKKYMVFINDKTIQPKPKSDRLRKGLFQFTKKRFSVDAPPPMERPSFSDQGIPIQRIRHLMVVVDKLGREGMLLMEVGKTRPTCPGLEGEPSNSWITRAGASPADVTTGSGPNVSTSEAGARGRGGLPHVAILLEATRSYWEPPQKTSQHPKLPTPMRMMTKPAFRVLLGRIEPWERIYRAITFFGQIFQPFHNYPTMTTNVKDFVQACEGGRRSGLPGPKVYMPLSL
ncbi:hypothetical protein NE237_000092 [Protea cynaroides]|uniref:Uncharacterized protein n=1 Tax=Protea cynaroides TaxID=273540 RepID=A0A9Q0JT96_9MAGN|nr:hypothetical protein NE237_000092 [Protea cynaroides]